MASTRGRLYEVDGYPGLVLGNSQNNGKVYGELYRLLNPQQVLNALDDYEECSSHFPKPHEYVRKQIPVNCLDSNKIVLAWVYLYNRPTTGLHLIPSGDYCLPSRKSAV